ncbi:MAG: hypothetical protein Q8N65_00645 [bacterium]|nr:hypothetical protein [bacterium]
MDKKLLVLVLVGTVLAVAAGVGGYIFGYQKGYGAGVEIGRAAAKTGAKDVVANPLEKLPEINPFKKVVNPFEAGYVNPFK